MLTRLVVATSLTALVSLSALELSCILGRRSPADVGGERRPGVDAGAERSGPRLPSASELAPSPAPPAPTFTH